MTRLSRAALSDSLRVLNNTVITNDMLYKAIHWSIDDDNDENVNLLLSSLENCDFREEFTDLYLYTYERCKQSFRKVTAENFLNFVTRFLTKTETKIDENIDELVKTIKKSELPSNDFSDFKYVPYVYNQRPDKTWDHIFF